MSTKDQELDWELTKKSAGIESVTWPHDSRKAEIAYVGYYTYSVKGDLLKRYVSLMEDIDAVLKEAENDKEEYRKYLELKAKYE